jgi:hypothetical protein
MMCAVALASAGACVDQEEETRTSSTEQALGPQIVARHMMNGGSVGFGHYDWETGTNFFVTAHESGTGSSRTVGLMFSYWGYDPTSHQCDWLGCYYTRYTSIWGEGQIQPGDLTIPVNGSSGQLVTTTGPSFWVQTCTESGCTSGGSYTFDLSFTGNGFMRHEQSGTRVFSMGAPDWTGQILEFRESGAVRGQGATVSGTAFGQAIEYGHGHIHRSVGGSVIRDLARTNP